MNTDSPLEPRAEIEARVTALLLGELPADEATAVRRAIEQDTELAQLHERLKQTIGLLREAASSSVEEATTPVSPLRLSARRREPLLQSFKTIVPKEFVAPRSRELPWYVPMSIAAVLVAMIGAVTLLPGFWAMSRFELATLNPTSAMSARGHLSDELETATRGLSFRENAEAGAPQPPPRAPQTIAVREEQAPKVAVDAIVPQGIVTEGNARFGGGGGGGGIGGGGGGGFAGPRVAITQTASTDQAGRNAGAAGFSPDGSALASSQAPPLAVAMAGKRAGASESAKLAENSLALPEEKVPNLGDKPTLGRFFRATNSFALSEPNKNSTLGFAIPGLAVQSPNGIPESEARRKSAGDQIQPQGGAAPSEPANQFVGRYAYIGPATWGLQPAKPETDSLGVNVNGVTHAADNSWNFNLGAFAAVTGAASDKGNQSSLDPAVKFGDFDNDANAQIARSLSFKDAANQPDDAKKLIAFPGDSAGPQGPQPSQPAADSKSQFDPIAQSVAGNSLGLPLPAMLPAPTSALESKQVPMDRYRMDPRLAARYGLLPPGKPASEPSVEKLARMDGAQRAEGLDRGETSLSAGLETGQVIPQQAIRETQQRALAEKDLSLAAQANAKSDATRQTVATPQYTPRIDPATGLPLPPASPAPQGAVTLTLADSEAGGVAQTLEPETVRGFEREQLNAQARAAQYQGQIEQLTKLKSSNREEFGKAVAKAVPDRDLNDLVGKLNKAETQLAQSSSEPGQAPTQTQELAGTVSALRAQVDARAEGVVNGLAVQVQAQTAAANSLSDQVALSKERDEKLTEQYHPYFRAKKEALTAAPPSSPVKILNLAQADKEKSQGLWDRLRGAMTGEVERSARIEVGKDSPDLAALSHGGYGGSYGGYGGQAMFDPYFVQTEFEKVKSKAVLYKVIEKLNLNDGWARKHGAHGKLNDAETYQLLVKDVDVRQDRDSNTIDIRVHGDNPQEAANIANTIAEVYRDLREQISQRNAKLLAFREQIIAAAKAESDRPQSGSNSNQVASPRPKLAASAPIPQPEVDTHENAFSTFSLNVSDVSFKLAAASLEKGLMPDPATVRSEEFINAFDYRDPEPPPGVPVAFAWERAHYPFAQDRDILRFSIKTAAQGRQAGYPLNLVLLLDRSGSMERADRVQTVHEALRVLAGQLQPQDKLSLITFARTARLWADGASANQATQIVEQAASQTPEGGTNLEDALNLAYQTALKNYIQGGGNRVVLLTDGAANLGNVDPDALKRKVEAHRQQGVALDCFGIGWEGFNDDLLENLARNGDGRYGFLNTPEEAALGFAGQLAGALHVAASDVKVQVEFNPKRVTVYRQIGYAKHQLTKEQFRDNSVDAAEMGAAESGNALYTVQVDPRGEGDLAVVRVRYKVPGTAEYHEHEWAVPYTGNAVALEQAGPALRLAVTASAFSEWLVSSPYAAEVTADRLLACLRGVPAVYGIDPRPKKLEWMIRQAGSVAGK